MPVWFVRMQLLDTGDWTDQVGSYNQNVGQDCNVVGARRLGRRHRGAVSESRLYGLIELWEVAMRSKSRGRVEVGMPATSVPLQSPSSLDSGTVPPRAMPGWPAWARVVVSLAIVFHLVAIVAGALGVPPSSLLERTIADPFTPYYDLVDLGYSYRYYAEPPPTPVVTATKTMPVMASAVTNTCAGVVSGYMMP